MEIEFEGGNALLLLLIALILLLLLFGLAGRFVTPVAASEPQLLTPARWTAYNLQRVASKETEALIADAARLRDVLTNETPDPIQAMLLAQAIYATHQSGSSATAAARQALIDAAEAAVQAATGELSHDEAITRFNAALLRINALDAPSTPVQTIAFP